MQLVETRRFVMTVLSLCVMNVVVVIVMVMPVFVVLKMISTMVLLHVPLQPTILSTGPKNTGARTGVLVMLQVKFFQVPSGNYYVKVCDTEFCGAILDCTWLKNVYEHTAAYIKGIMLWDYSRSEIEFIIDSTCDTDAADSITRDISIYADEV